MREAAEKCCSAYFTIVNNILSKKKEDERVQEALTHQQWSEDPNGNPDWRESYY